MKLKIKCTGEHKPTRGSTSAAGIDLYNNDAHVAWLPQLVYIEEDNAVHHFDADYKIRIDTKTHVEIPEGYVGLVFPRSGLGSKGLRLANSTGVIDSDYRGPIIVVLEFNGERPFKLCKGERFAQLVIVPHYVYEMEFVDELSDTERGEDGFGSTGTK